MIAIRTLFKGRPLKTSLNYAERCQVQIYARQMYAIEGLRPWNLKVSEREWIKRRVAGAGAEVAFAKLVNRYVTLESTPYDERYYDFDLPGIGKVDIKNTVKTNGKIWINANLHHKQKPDYYIYTLGHFPHYTILGYISTEKALIDEHKHQTRTEGLKYVFDRSKLKRFEGCLN